MTEEQRQKEIEKRQKMLTEAEDTMASMGLHICERTKRETKERQLQTIKVAIELEKDIALAKATEKSDALPDGFQVGKLIHMSVADGLAYYEIVKVYQHTVKLKWRSDLQVDSAYRDSILQDGGNFRKKDLQPVVAFIDIHRDIKNSHLKTNCKIHRT